jgi:hypothetical protein
MPPGKGRNTIYKILKKELNYVPYNRLVKNNLDESTTNICSERTLKRSKINKKLFLRKLQ